MIIRFLPTRVEFVEVYTEDGEYIGRAPWTRYLDAAEAAQASADRRDAIRTFRTALEEIAESDATAVEAHKAAATAAEPGEDDDTYGARPTTTRRKKAESPSTTRRKAAERARERTQFEVLGNTVVARTGTDDLDF